MGEMEKNLGEVQRSSLRPPRKVRDKVNDVTYACSVHMYTRKNLTSCSKSANKPSTSRIRTACPKLSTSLEQVVNNL